MLDKLKKRLLIIFLISAMGLSSLGMAVDYQTESFSATTEPLYNPYKGFYTLVNMQLFPGMGMPDLYMDSLTTKLLLVEFKISAFGDGDIGEHELDIMGRILDEYDEAGKSVIVRMLYDWNGKAPEYEPSDISIVEKHMEQVAPVLNSHKDMILLHQGIFIGNCAEMNGSKFGTDDDCTRLYLKLESVLDDDILIGVRTPRYHRLFTDAGANINRIAFYNDGMFGSSNDLGTYTVEGYDRERELDFQDEYARYVPNGGEVTLLASESDAANCIPEMYRMHVSHLNKDHYIPTMNKWRADVYHSDGVGSDKIWDNTNAFTYIDQHLGYRYEINDFKADTYTSYPIAFVPEYLQLGLAKDYLRLSVTMYNSGFASTTKSLIPYITLADDDGHELTVRMQGDMRTLFSRESRDYEVSIPVEWLQQTGLYDKNLTASFFILDKRNAEEIKLATDSRYDENSHHIVGYVHCR